MTCDDIIKLALEAGGCTPEWDDFWELHEDALVRFHAIAVAAERKACAQVCEELRDSFLSPQYATGQPMSSIGERFAAGRCAEAIRARSEA